MKNLTSLILLTALLFVGTKNTFSQTNLNNCLLTVNAPDEIGNMGFWVAFHTTNDSTSAPIVQFDVLFDGNALGGYLVAVDNQNDQHQYGAVMIQIPQGQTLGAHIIEVRAYSNSALQCVGQDVVILTNGSPTTGLYLGGQNSPYAPGETVTTVLSTVNASGNTTICWGDGDTTVTPLTGGAFTHVYAHTGTYAITATNNGAVTGKVIYINDPTVQFLPMLDAPDTVYVNQPFTINYNAGTYPNINVIWDDGTVGNMINTNTSIMHTYTVPGIYQVSYYTLNELYIQPIVAINAAPVPMQITSPMGGEIFAAGVMDYITVNTTATGRLDYTFIDNTGDTLSSGTVNSAMFINGTIKTYSVQWPVSVTGSGIRVIATVTNNMVAGTDTSNAFTMVDRVVHGLIYYDFNSNGTFDNNDWPYYPTAINVSPGTFNLEGDVDGNYWVSSLQAGNVTISPVLPANFSVSPSQHTVDVSAPGMYTGYDFALQPMAGALDFDLRTLFCRSFTGIFSSSIVINITNLGPAQSAPTTVTYTYNPAQMVITTTTIAPIQQQPGSITFSVPALAPGQYFAVHIFQNLPVPVGTVITESASVPPIDMAAGNNAFENTFFATGATDPNAITATPGIIYTPNNADPGYIYYSVQFQNTGSGEAHNIRVNDTIAANLNMNTFELIESSHTMNTIIRPGGVVDFMFPNIMLPDSNANEPASHGHIIYRIKPTGTLPLNSSTNAKVGIYFDYNEAVVTNTTSTVVLNPLGVAEQSLAEFTIYPNPANGIVYIQPNGVYQNDKLTLRIFAVDGRLVYSESYTAGNTPHAVNTSAFAKGLYSVQLSNGKVSSSQKVVVN